MIVVFHIQLFLNDRILGNILSVLAVLITLIICIPYFREIYAGFSGDPGSYMFALKAGNLILMNLIMAYLMFNKGRLRETNGEADIA
jgi:hypothetical protein